MSDPEEKENTLGTSETEKTIKNLYFIFETKIMVRFISTSRLYSNRSTICIIVN